MDQDYPRISLERFEVVVGLDHRNDEQIANRLITASYKHVDLDVLEQTLKKTEHFFCSHLKEHSNEVEELLLVGWCHIQT